MSFRTTMPLKMLAPAAALALILTGCSGSGDAAQTDEVSTTAEAATLRVNFSGFPENWTPGQEIEGGLLRVPYETLLKPGENGEPAPNLATDYELTPEAMTLTLRDDVTFHDGEQFNAEAVKTNIETVMEGSTVWTGSFSVVDSVEVVDEYTLQINLTEPTPSFPMMLTARGLPIGSPAAIEDGTIAQHPVGTSPWAYDPDASISGTRMHFKAFEEYWGEKPGFANIEIFAIGDEDSSAAALVNNEIDLSEVESSVLPTFEGTEIETLDYPAIRNNLIFFDRGEGGMFESQALRQAVCHAIDVEETAGVIDGVIPVNQHFAEGEPGHNDSIEGYPADMAKAETLYQEAGSPNISFEMAAAPYNEQQIRIYLDHISRLDGIKGSAQTMPPPQVASVWSSGQYPVGLNSNDELTPYEWYTSWFAEDAPGNPAGVESSELKAAAEAAIAAGDSKEAVDLWAAVTAIISDEALTCAHGQSEETLAWNPVNVSNVAAPVEPWEPQSVNYRDLVPAQQ